MMGAPCCIGGVSAESKANSSKAWVALCPLQRALAFDALLEQLGEGIKRNQGWVPEVLNPVLCKMMALELSRDYFPRCTKKS
jgi:hypothetical protein